MKIKRFEARSMSEALRMVKKEFGDDAVILSATNSKKNGKLFRSKAGGEVVVTAAIDMEPANKTSNRNATQDDAQMSEQVSSKNGDRKDGFNSRMLHSYQPITKTGQKKIRPKLVKLMAEQTLDDLVRSPASVTSMYDRLRSQALSPMAAKELSDQMIQLHADENASEEHQIAILGDVLSAKKWVDHTMSLPLAQNSCIALIGSHGAGKTSVAARIAAMSILAGGQSPVLISIDCQRAAAAHELEKLSKVMGTPLYTAHDEEQFKALGRDIGKNRPVIIDTSGISLGDADSLKTLEAMFAAFPRQLNVFLVINGCLREKIMRRTMEFFQQLNTVGMIFTQLDLIDEYGHLFNPLEESEIPVAFFSNSPRVSDGLIAVKPAILSEMLLNGRVPAEEMSSVLDDVPVTVVKQRSFAKKPGRYVANCNSDIFHHQSCKSVKRISREHMLTFEDAHEAKEQGFKPCRMCCPDLFSPKPIDRLVRSHQASRRQVL